MLTLLTVIGFALIVYFKLQDKKYIDAFIYMAVSFVVFGLSAFIEISIILNFLGVI